MSQYVKSPFKQPPALIYPGTPVYVLGSFDDKSAPTQGFVLSDSAATTTGTLTFLVTSGNVPLVGDKITVVGTANGGGNMNVTNATILTVTAGVDANGFQSGVVTVTYAISSTTFGTTADAGQVIVPRSEIAELLVGGGAASVPVAMPYNNTTYNQNQGITAVVSFPSIPTSVTVSLQQAVFDIDSEYVTIATVATVAGSAVTTGPQITVDPTVGRFFRLSYGTVTGGTNPSIIGKLLI